VGVVAEDGQGYDWRGHREASPHGGARRRGQDR